MTNGSGIQGIRLDHVAVATERQDAAWPRYAGDLGGRWISRGESVGFTAAQVAFANGMRLEVLEPNLVEHNDFLRRFLDRNGPGPHHLTYKVPSLPAALGQAEAAGYRPVSVDMSDANWKEAFLHPKDAPGVVIQLAQAAHDWSSPPPADLPPSRRSQPAVLEHVTHVVGDLADGTRLFRDLLSGDVLAEGSEEVGRWLLLGWPGPGRVRLVCPRPGTPLHDWLGSRVGAVHHVAFALDDPADVPAAKETADGAWEVAPEDNDGVRLILRRS